MKNIKKILLLYLSQEKNHKNARILRVDALEIQIDIVHNEIIHYWVHGIENTGQKLIKLTAESNKIELSTTKIIRRLSILRGTDEMITIRTILPNGSYEVRAMLVFFSLEGKTQIPLRVIILGGSGSFLASFVLN